MKIAICLSGQARCFDYHQTHELLFPGHEVDYFCFFWDYFLTDDDKENKINEIYHPKKLVISPYIEFQEYINHVLDCGIRTWNTFPMWYAIQQADLLRRQYEHDHGFKYDAVLRSRTDNFFNPNNGSWISALQSLRENDIILPSKYNFTDWQNLPGYNDQLALGTSQSMITYSDMFSWFETAFKLYPNYWGIERLLLLYIENYNKTHEQKINIKHVDVDYKLIRPSEKGVSFDRCRGYMNPAELGIRNEDSIL